MKIATNLLAAVALALLLWRPLSSGGDSPAGEMTAMRVGYTFSARQADYLDLPWQQTFDATLALDPNVVRLGAYWDEIERQPGRFDFDTLDWQMDRAASAGRPVVLTVGMKAPRWPEYFLPPWLNSRVADRAGAISDDPEVRARTQQFIAAVVQRYAGHPALRYWQVENEPLDPAGPHGWYIRPEFLASEIATVRQADPQRHPIVLTMFVHLYPLASVLPWSRGDDERSATLLELGDVLGLDVYPSVSLRAFGQDLYFNFLRWDWPSVVEQHAARAHQQGKQAWIMEAQAEPWEPSQVVAMAPGPARSLSPSQAEGIFDRLRVSGFDTILVWGVEHWYMRKELQQDASWWDAGQQLIEMGQPGSQVAAQPQ